MLKNERYPNGISFVFRNSKLFNEKKTTKELNEIKNNNIYSDDYNFLNANLFESTDIY